MQSTSSPSCHWSQSIFTENGWKSREELIDFLTSISEDRYTDNNFPEKAIFIQSIRRLIISIELDGDAVKEAKQMTAQGSVFESLNSDYRFIRDRYLQKRRKLKGELAAIRKVIARI